MCIYVTSAGSRKCGISLVMLYSLELCMTCSLVLLPLICVRWCALQLFVMVCITETFIQQLDVLCWEVKDMLEIDVRAQYNFPLACLCVYCLWCTQKLWHSYGCIKLRHHWYWGEVLYLIMHGQILLCVVVVLGFHPDTRQIVCIHDCYIFCWYINKQ